MRPKSTAKLTTTQATLLDLLQTGERSGSLIEITAIAQKTGWKPSTVVTYLRKGHLDAFLTKVSPSAYEVHGVIHLTETEFLQALTQKQGARELGFWTKSLLARALLRKSRDNMILALELYNRPSIENRLDAFAMLFMTAWEQLLKARLIERDGEASIFRDPRPGKPRETVGFHTCLEAFYPEKDCVRRNIERIRDLRDEATHLLVPELQTLLSRVFQSGVLNFASAFLDFAKTPFLPRHAVGLLTIVGDQTEASVVRLRATYGHTTGDEVHNLLSSLKDEIARADDAEFAIPVRLKLSFSEEGKAGDIVLTKGLDVGEKVVVVEKAVDIDKTHPHLETDAVRAVNQRLKSLLSEDEIASRLTGPGKPKSQITSWDFQAIAFKEKWKASNRNQYHIRLNKPVVRRYSDEAVIVAAESIAKFPDYLEKVRAAFRNARAESRRKAA
jgi:hypothetical protein